MANDYVLRLTGDASGLNKTIKETRDNITQLTGTSTKLEQVNQRFQRIDSSSAPLRKKLRDVKLEMEKLAQSGDANSDTFNRLADAAKRYQASLDQVNRATSTATGSGNALGGQLEGLLGKMTGGNMGNVGQVLGGEISGALNGLTRSIPGASQALSALGGAGGIASAGAMAATAGIGAAAAIMVSAGKAAADFETHLDSLQSLTGLDNDAMKTISDGAVDMSRNFRSSASDIVDSMKLIGSQAPELLKDSDALMKVTEAANILSEAAQIGVVEAASGITTVINQMGVSASEATDIINVLAAASQQGAGDVDYLNTAFEKTGTMAKSSGMDYTELAAAIETVAPKFSSADVAGSQFSSTLLALTTQGNDKFNPAVVGMQQALENMADAGLDNADIVDLVGKSNVNMLSTLIEGRDTFAGYTESLAGTNTATEMMATNNDNLEGAVARLKSQWDAFLITLGQSALIEDVATLIGLICDNVGLLINEISDIIDSFDLFDTSMDKAGEAAGIANGYIETFRDIIKGVSAAIQVLVGIVAKCFNAIKGTVEGAVREMRRQWGELQARLMESKYVQAIANAWKKVYDTVTRYIEGIRKTWNDLMEKLGLTKLKITVEAEDVEVDVEVSEPEVNEPEEKESTKTGTGNGTPTPLVSGDDAKQAERVAGSLAEAQDMVRKLNEQLQNTDIGSGQVPILRQQLDLWQEIAEERKKAIGEAKVEVKPEIPQGSLADIERKISETKAELELSIVGSEEFYKLSDDLKKLERDEHLIKVSIDTGQSTEDIAANEQRVQDLTERYEQQKETLGTYSDLMGSVGETFNGLGNAIGGIGGQVLSVAGAMAQGTADILAQVAQIVAAKQAEAMASGTASAAAMPFPANIAAIAAIIATIIGVFASIAGTFAEGGIVSGGTTHGDRLLARVNAGEMILNPRQQANLFDILDRGGATGGMGGKVEFEISGSSLKGVMRNYDRKLGKMQ